MRTRRTPLPYPSRYDRVSQAAAAQVIAGYSTSFGWASRLLDEPVRTHVRSIYALVRIADEIVDDPAPVLTPGLRATLLDTGRSANLVVHAFVVAARQCGIGYDLLAPFFASMRRDLGPGGHTEESLDRYVYGSAEVVGLMCLRAFVDGDEEAYQRLQPGARRLGAAFQKVNFLRDLADDQDLLGRTYFPGIDPERFTDAQRDAILDDIDADLAAAASVIPQLPASSRRAVQAAHALYASLSSRLRRTPAQEIRRRRVRVPDSEKLGILARAVAGRAS